jgi:hypothetical protein
VLNGDRAKAEDQLIKHPDGAALWKLAYQVASEKERAKHVGRASVTPQTVGL